MPEEINVNKSLIKKVVTFLNKYVDNPHIVCGYTKYPSHISISIQIWDLNDSSLGKNIDCFMEYVNSKTNLDSFKIKMKEKIDEALKTIK